MLRFNIINVGFLELADPEGVSFKMKNPFFRFADISLGRSTEFSIPATDYNRHILGFGEDAALSGDMLRAVYPCQMDYDGGQKMGTLAITGYEGSAFKCVFTIGNAEWIDAIQNKKLSDCVSSWTKGVLWSLNASVIDADQADPTQGAQILKYDNGHTGGNWQLAPSVNVGMYIDDILNNLNIPHGLQLSHDYWMVAGSMKGGSTDSFTIGSTAANVATITGQTENYLSVVDIDIEWATILLFKNGAIGGGSFPAKGFQALDDIQITFPVGSPTCYMVRWSRKLSRYTQLAGPSLDGMTVTVRKGEIFFFASTPVYWTGYQDTFHPYSIFISVDSDASLTLGETWFMRNNHPDMTVFEFLKSVCLATGLELTVDGENGVSILPAEYGGTTDFKALTNVLSVDSVSRVVESWGNGTKKVEISFDSDDYVTQKIVSTYEVDNEQVEETETFESKFSEGNYGDNGVLIEDVDDTSSPPKFKGKKWTLALATTGSTWLQRVSIPTPIGCEDIAVNSTCMRVKIAAGVSEFFKLAPSTTWIWRGGAYVWTEADWSNGVLSMTLQRVSQQ